MASKKDSGPAVIRSGLVAANKRARYDYEILEEFEAGLVLTGTEVKSLRYGRAQILEAYATVKNGEAWLVNASISPYAMGNIHNHEEKRPRKCLLKAKQIKKIGTALATKGMSLVPLRLYFNDRGMAKVMLGLGKGKKEYEKRSAIKDRDWNREKAQLLRDRG